MAAPLDDAGLAAALRALPRWTGTPTALRREATLPSFRAAIEAVVRIADIAEELDHHPDIDVRWRRLVLVCATHDADGRVTELDVALATRIEDALAAAGADAT
jgi:4a-hydroxytetrahydrobiopterin dehydratase